MCMLAEERRNQILERLYVDGYVRTRALVQELDVSDVTLRGDLQELERRGRLIRTRGGAMAPQASTGKSTFDARLMRNKGAKQRIALAAAQFVRGDQTVIFDAGTTLLALAHHMPPVSGVTVVTPGLNTAQHLLGVDGVDVVVIGGPVDRDTLSTVWPASMPGEVGFAAHTAFIGAHGIDNDLDLVDASLAGAVAKRRLVEAGRRVILLADSSKWGENAAFKVTKLTAVDLVITDDDLREDVAQEIRDAGVELILV